MKKIFYPFISLCFVLLLCCCQNSSTKQHSSFSEKKSNCSALHYWDEFDFTDKPHIRQSAVLEQAFVNFATLLFQMSESTAENSIYTLLTRAQMADRELFSHLCDLAQKYLYEPNSPLYDERAYIPFLRFIIDSENPESGEWIRARYQLRMALKNQEGDIATNFTFQTYRGEKFSLYSLKQEYILLFFYDPACRECNRVKEEIQMQSDLLKQKAIKVLAIHPTEDISSSGLHLLPPSWLAGVCPDILPYELYDLKAMPTLYLLDRDKRVIYKDISFHLLMDL